MENDEFRTIVCKDAFNEDHTETSQSVLVSDEQGLNGSLLCKVEESPEPTTLHVESRADVCEDYGTGLEVAFGMSDESLKLAVKVTISLLTMSRDPGIDCTLLSIRMFKNLLLKCT